MHKGGPRDQLLGKTAVGEGGERPLLDLVAWGPRMLLGGAELRQRLGWGGEQGLAGDKAWPWA